MEAVWFAIISAMLAIYAVLDGFDFGVGAIHRIVARTEEERRVVLASIGPIWDGNEVWLIAAGGVLFMAFPRVYATAFSGFYLALVVVLWLLILRGVAIEFRSHQDNPLWREFWDTIFSLASALLAVLFGTTLGNLLRGVPLGKEGLRGMPLFTNFLTGREPGILDWYTGLVGLFTLAALAVHGALYLAWRTAGPVRDRSLAFAHKAWKAVLVLWAAATAATGWVRAEGLHQSHRSPLVACLRRRLDRRSMGSFLVPETRPELAAFLSSSAFLLGIVGRDAGGPLPVLAAVDSRVLLQPHRLQRRIRRLRIGRGTDLVGRRDLPGRRIFLVPVPLDAWESRCQRGEDLLSRSSRRPHHCSPSISL